MNIALIGSGGREHVLCQKIYESKLSKNIICIPGNAGTSRIAKNIDLDFLNFKKFKSIFFAIFEVPAFPGIQTIFLHNLDSYIFWHKTCSLPPLPIKAIFI